MMTMVLPDYLSVIPFSALVGIVAVVVVAALCADVGP